MTVMIPFEEGQRHLDWLALTDALAAGHEGQQTGTFAVLFCQAASLLIDPVILNTLRHAIVQRHMTGSGHKMRPHPQCAGGAGESSGCVVIATHPIHS